MQLYWHFPDSALHPLCAVQAGVLRLKHLPLWQASQQPLVHAEQAPTPACRHPFCSCAGWRSSSTCVNGSPEQHQQGLVCKLH